jgi:hypothetical protein
MKVSIIFSMVFLFLIAISDFRSRQIPVLLLFGELILSILIGYSTIGVYLIKAFIINCLVLGFQFVVLWVIVKKSAINSDSRIWSKFGIGDLVMLVVVAVNFSLLNYLIFTVIICIVSLVVYAVSSFTNKDSVKTIPFAGILALGIMLIRISNLLCRGLNCYSDILIRA